MSDNFEFDDNDDILLNAFCTPPSTTISEKRLSEGNDENLTVKRTKSNENTKDTLSPILQFSHKLSGTPEKGTPVKNNLLPNATKRIFPGPAGILLDENQTDICSQDSFFQDGPWKDMSKDFKISDSLYLFDKFNIAWIKKEAANNKFVNQKAPFLAGILLSLEVSEGQTQKSINITLRDMTGTIQGTISQNLYGEYASHFTLGSVMVLIQFGVLSCTCDRCDNHHLTVTPKNLGALYSGKEKIIIKHVNPDEVLKDYCQRKESELATTNRNLSRPNNFSSPVISNVNSNRCTFNKNINLTFQNPGTSRNTMSPNIVNRTVKDSEHTLQNASVPNQSFALPNVRTIDKSIVKVPVVKEVQESQCPENSPPVTPTRLFTFKKANNLSQCNVSESNTSPLSDTSKMTITQMLPIINSMEETKKDTDNENVDIVKIGNSRLSVKADTAEHEKIWEDLLENVDVNSFFDDDF